MLSLGFGFGSGSASSASSAALKHTRSDPTPTSNNNNADAKMGGGVDLAELAAHSSESSKTITRAGEQRQDKDKNKDAEADAEKERERARERAARTRLAFADYLIKPVQRVCKYPLLFEQLRTPIPVPAPSPAPAQRSFSPTSSLASTLVPRPTSPASPMSPGGTRRAAFRLGGDSDGEDDDDEREESGDEDEDGDGEERWFEAQESTDEEAADDQDRFSSPRPRSMKSPRSSKGLKSNDGNDANAAERTLHAMRGVAHAVDEARRRRELEHKSALIVERLVGGTPGAANVVHVPQSQHQQQQQHAAEDANTNANANANANHSISGGPSSFFGNGAPVHDEPGEMGDVQSELGHGTGLMSMSMAGRTTTNATALAVAGCKPPARSLSFSAAFARSKSRTRLARGGRVGSLLLSAANAGDMDQANSHSIWGHSRTASGVSHLTAGDGDASSALDSGSGTPALVQGPPSRTFLESLGACLLAGSLDVVVRYQGSGAIGTGTSGAGHALNTSFGAGNGLASMGIVFPAGPSDNANINANVNGTQFTTSTSPMPAPTTMPQRNGSNNDLVKVKYLAAFLYVGGYVVLAKTPKAGAYEARHWFSLLDESVEVVDVKEEDGECSLLLWRYDWYNFFL